jgi:Flp pilus assembly protein TadD
MRPILVAVLVASLACAGCGSLRGARLYSSGTRALDAGDPARAVADLEAAAALLPGSSEVHNHLGLAYARAGRDEEAMAAFRRSVELDCDNRAAQHNLHAAEAGRLRPPEPQHGP